MRIFVKEKINGSTLEVGKKGDCNFTNFKKIRKGSNENNESQRRRSDTKKYSTFLQ